MIVSSCLHLEEVEVQGEFKHETACLAWNVRAMHQNWQAHKQCTNWQPANKVRPLFQHLKDINSLWLLWHPSHKNRSLLIRAHSDKGFYLISFIT